VRIAEADPVGFLLAIMHGQPIPEFRVTKSGGVEIFYNTPTFEQRERVAKWLGSRVTLRLDERDSKHKHVTGDWDTMVHNAAGEGNGNSDARGDVAPKRAGRDAGDPSAGLQDVHDE
jgi:hypothetical protein